MMTGHPLAFASTTGIENPSVREGQTVKMASWYSLESSASLSPVRKWMRSADPPDLA